MPRVLCVAEKPSIAKALAHALGGGNVGRPRDSSVRFIKNYDVGYNSPKWGPCDVTVTSVSGHLTDIEFLPPFDKFDSDPLGLFAAPIKTVITSEGQKVAKNIQNQSRGAQILYIWTDCDREGEHIGGEIVDAVRKVNAGIDVYRAKFNNTDQRHLLEAAGRPGRLDWRQYEAVCVRRELDLRSGFSMTRLQTQMYRSAFPVEFASKLVPYGSCQFPTMGFIVERYLRAKNHVPESSWKIDAIVKAAAPAAPGQPGLHPLWDRGSIFDHMVALTFFERALDRGTGKFRITSVDTKPTSRYRPLPLTTVTLQKSGSSLLKMNSKKIMTIAEQLYNQGIVSYPRTETDRFDKDIDLRGLVNKHANIDSPWKSYAASLANGSSPKFRTPRNGPHDDKAHPPIHPVKAVTRNVMTSADHWRVYEFITRHFLACCSEDAKGLNTNMGLEYGGEKFHLSGTQVLELNFLEVYIYDKWANKALPNWKVGDEVDCTSFNLKEVKTTPPPLLTEAALIGLMDANGIGTDATMADHIHKIQDRDLVRNRNGYFEPTALGLALYQSYEKIGLEISLTKPFLRHETEVAVTDVAEGRLNQNSVLGSLVAKYETAFKQARRSRNKLMSEARIHLATPPLESR